MEPASARSVQKPTETEKQRVLSLPQLAATNHHLSRVICFHAISRLVLFCYLTMDEAGSGECMCTERERGREREKENE